MRTYIHTHILTYIRTYIHTYTYVHMHLCTQLLQEFIAVWRWTIYQRWGIYSVDETTDGSGKMFRPSATQHSIMTKVYMYVY